eukprot:4326387-Prymnesium_polylepis.1
MEMSSKGPFVELFAAYCFGMPEYVAHGPRVGNSVRSSGFSCEPHASARWSSCAQSVRLSSPASAKPTRLKPLVEYEPRVTFVPAPGRPEGTVVVAPGSKMKE